MRIIAADWMGNSSEYNAGHVSKLREEGVGVPVTFRSRPAAPTAAQVLLASCMNLYVDVALDWDLFSGVKSSVWQPMAYWMRR